ncbi:hypothetical protein CPC08DRAFT_800475, partial [Agrocybe pediades]
MSTTDEFPFSVAQQKALIIVDLNSTLLALFLFGIYTGIFLATVYIYSHKENRTRARDMIIIGNTGALYFLIALSIVMNWIYTDILYCTKGAMRVDMFIESLMGDMPLGEQIIEDVTSLAIYLFADGVLVWRCFHACGRSFRKSLLPIVLLTVETVLGLRTVAVAYGLRVLRFGYRTRTAGPWNTTCTVRLRTGRKGWRHGEYRDENEKTHVILSVRHLVENDELQALARRGWCLQHLTSHATAVTAVPCADPYREPQKLDPYGTATVPPVTPYAVLVLTATVYRCLIDAKSDFNTIQTTENSNRLIAAADIAVVLTSLVSTGIICLQIWRHTSPSSRSRKHYKTIIHALMESSAIYTVIVLLEAVFAFTLTGNTQSYLTIFFISEFINVASQITS